MTGLEGPMIAGVAGKLLGSLAAPAAKALVGKLTFRWQVWWLVRKGFEHHCPWGPYRKWLKTLSAEELSCPVEEVHGPLAIRLDEALSAKSLKWRSAVDHLSRALRLVELTYPAIAGALGDSERTLLSETWAQRRDASVRETLLQLAGPTAALSESDRKAIFYQRSDARRAVRLQAFGIDTIDLAAYFARIEPIDVPVGEVRVLLGDFGSGKSEAAEAWHRAAIEDLNSERNTSLPGWLSARDLRGQTLENAIEQQVGPAWRHGRGAAIAVDGLDEADPASAQALLEAARIIAKTFPNIRFLLTARPGILSPTEAESVTVGLLPEDVALDLVESVSGRQHSTWRWTADMRSTVTRPFFALGAGLMLKRDEVPNGEVDLIRGLVEDALQKGTERSVLTTIEKRSVLKRLAVALTRTGIDGLSFSDRQIARSSRLIADGPEGSVQFSLPIFQHWFAAQAILGCEVPAAELVSDLENFSRWRWAAAVAALSAPSEEAVDDLLETLVAGNAGAAAWILREAFSENRSWRTDDDEHLDARTSGPRLLRALRTWTDALGPLALGIFPVPVTQGPILLGVTVSGRHHIDVAYSTMPAEADNVTDVPLGLNPFQSSAVPGWRAWFGGRAHKGIAWPWLEIREKVAGATRDRLASSVNLGAPDGVWVQERRFDLARRLLGRGSLFFGDLPTDEVKDRALEVFERVDRMGHAQVSIRRTIFLGVEFEALLQWIDTKAPEAVRSNLPNSDVTSPQSNWVWDSYSPQRLLAFEAEVYGRACEAYDEALERTFSKLRWSMPQSTLSPFGIVLELTYNGAPGMGGIPQLNVMQVPMELISKFVPAGSGAIWATSGRAAATLRGDQDVRTDHEHQLSKLELIHSWLAGRGQEPIRSLTWVDTTADDMSKVRPASNLAADWLFRDLSDIGLGSGGSPILK